MFEKKFTIGIGMIVGLGMSACGDDSDVDLALEAHMGQDAALQETNAQHGCLDGCAPVNDFWAFAAIPSHDHTDVETLPGQTLEAMLTAVCNEAVAWNSGAAASHDAKCKAHVKKQEQACNEQSLQDCTFTGACQPVTFTGDMRIVVQYESIDEGVVLEIDSCSHQQKTGKISCTESTYERPYNAENLTISCEPGVDGGGATVSCTKKD